MTSVSLSSVNPQSHMFSPLSTRQNSFDLDTSLTQAHHQSHHVDPANLQLKFELLTGKSEWIVIDENEDVPETSQEPLLATTSYLDMLNDSCRNRAYRLAIEKTVTKPCHVLDIGAGTGLLSMMAARAMGSGDSTAKHNTKGTVQLASLTFPW